MPNAFIRLTEQLDGLADTHLIVTANERLAREYRHSLDLYRLRSGRTAWPTIQCVSQARFFFDEWRRCAENPDALVDEGRLLATALHRAPPTLRHRIQPFLEAWSMVHEYDIDLSAAEFTTADGQQFVAWWQHVASDLDALTAVEKIPDYLEQRGAAPTRALLLVGFDQFTKPQHRYFSWLATVMPIELQDSADPRIVEPSTARDVFATGTAKAKSDSGFEPHLHTEAHTVATFEHLRQEVAAACVWARATKLADDRATVGIVVPNLAHHYDVVLRQAGATLAPHQGSDTPLFDIAGGRPLNETHVWRSLSALFDGILDGFSPDAIRMLAESPFVDLRALRTITRHWPQRFGRTVTLRQLADETALTEHDHALRHLAEMVEDSGQRSLTLAQWSILLRRWATAVGWPQVAALRSHQYQAFQRIEDIWRQAAQTLTACEPGAPQVSFAHALRYLDNLLRRHLFAPERDPADIRILGLLETHGLSFSHLWICGLDENSFPRNGSAVAFLPGRVRMRHGVPRSSAAQELVFARKLLRRWVASADTVRFSYARQAEDVILQPSPLLQPRETWQPLRELATSLETLAHPYIHYAARSAVQLDARVDSVGLPVIDDDSRRSKRVRGGATLIERQSLCPFRAYAEYRLDLREAPSPSDFPTHLERGSAVHLLLQRLLFRFATHAALIQANDGDLDQLCADTIADTYGPLPQSFTKHEQQRLRKLLQSWVALEAKRQPFTAIGTEVQHELSLGDIAITLRLDRIDEVDGRQVVIDYKTGTQPLPLPATLPDHSNTSLTSTQLPLYSLVGDEIDAVYYAYVREEPRFSGITAEDPPIEGGTPSRQPWDQLKRQWQQALEFVADSYARGRADVTPSAKACKHCHLASLCRKHALST